MAKLVIDQLKKSYGSNLILKGISTVIEDGELVSLLGASGCGKTTTLRCIAGFEIPDSGRILTNDREITGLLPEKRDIGMVFQNYALFPHMTVFENVAFGLRMRKLPEAEIGKRTAQALGVVGLTGFEKRFPRQLSGGQQQRVAIARAIVIRPSLLLLDEPLANLDAKLREEMRFYLKNLQKNVGITMVYVTHDQSEALVLSDRILVMKEGSVLQDASPRDVYCAPASLEVAKFIGLTNLFEGEAVGMGAGACRVRLSFGELACGRVPARGIAPGERVTVAVRPEAMQITADGAPVGPDWNTVAGTVVQKIFMGSSFDYRLGLASGETVRLQTTPKTDLPTGGPATLVFPVAETMVFSES